MQSELLHKLCSNKPVNYPIISYSFISASPITLVNKILAHERFIVFLT